MPREEVQQKGDTDTDTGPCLTGLAGLTGLTWILGYPTRVLQVFFFLLRVMPHCMASNPRRIDGIGNPQPCR